MIQIESRNIVERIRQWLLAGVDLIFPSRCAGCGRIGIVWCEDCQKTLQLLSKPLCNTCGKAVAKSTKRCNSCVNYPGGFRVRAYAKYQGPLLHAILHLKYRPNRKLALMMSAWLYDLLLRLGWQFDLIIPVPLGKGRLRRRGYNQSTLIAQGLSTFLDLEVDEIALSRTRETESQVGLGPVARLKNVKGAFIASQEHVEGKKILLVDDLVTTGATLSVCASALFDAGASRVSGIAVARA